MEQVTASPITEFNGLPIKLKIGPGQVAVFPVVIPADLQRFQLEFAETDDATDRMHRDAWVSKAAGFTEPVDDRPNRSALPDGSYDHVLIAKSTQGGAINFVVDGQSGVKVGMHGSHIEVHATAGETWYLNVVNHYNAKAKHVDPTAYTVFVTPSRINM